MNERLKFVAAAQRGDKTITELCLSFGIIRLVELSPGITFDYVQERTEGTLLPIPKE
ncbi:MAG: hypothetical protein JKY61_07665 [Planctomycetes bacterium]|nr:hypothetical protein [Planctomycetota bacterium]